MNDQLRARAAKVRLILMDVDGVLTDGKIYFLPGSEGALFETKTFDTQDGLAFHWLHAAGIKTGVISGRSSQAVMERARQGHMTYVYQGHLEKLAILEEILADARLSPEEVAYLGDDFTDVVIMKRVGLGVAVANARDEVKRMAHATTEARGGAGALREVTEWVLKAQGRWAGILAKYGIENG
ncbi:MAG TPA: 3-deoxy-D-manno-octulosonate 8-phosphate phosphatase [Solibacterales bacterium]|nr:3-deoxy-D-manno-octulosonate 8-phosphate phosphatase [Bryobacterales bacterium]